MTARMMRLRSAEGQSPGGTYASDIAGGKTITWRYRRLGFSFQEGEGIARGRFRSAMPPEKQKSQIAFSGFLRYNKTIFRAGCDSPLAVKSATCESS